MNVHWREFVCIACDGHGAFQGLACPPCEQTGYVDEAEWIRQAEIGHMKRWGPAATAQAVAWGTELRAVAVYDKYARHGKPPLTRKRIIHRPKTPRERAEYVRDSARMFERMGAGLRDAGMTWVPTPKDPTVNYGYDQ